MNYQIKAESGAQLVARLNQNPSAEGLDDKLFPSGPKPKETIEIKGDPSTGKTLLLTQFIMKAILPAEYKGVALGGLNVGVVFIETDSHFNVCKLFDLMEYTVLRKMRLKEVPIAGNEREELIKSALDNLILISCCSSAELFVTFHKVKFLLTVHKNVSLILLDSIAAFYQQDSIVQGIKRYDSYCKKTIEVLQQCVRDSNVTIIYTKPALYQSKFSVQEELPSEPRVGKINVKIELKFHESEPQMFSAIVQSSSSSTELKYKVKHGIKWL